MARVIHKVMDRVIDAWMDGVIHRTESTQEL